VSFPWGGFLSVGRSSPGATFSPLIDSFIERRAPFDSLVSSSGARNFFLEIPLPLGTMSQEPMSHCEKVHLSWLLTFQYFFPER